MFYLDPDSQLSLQAQLREKIVEAILVGSLAPGQRLPSSRKLSTQIGIARNTVVLAYEQLIDEGYLVTRARSGIYVDNEVLSSRVTQQVARIASGAVTDWSKRLSCVPDSGDFQPPPDWQQYPYPFIDGQFDQALFPVHEWREASRLSLQVGEVDAWSRYLGDADDPRLVDAIRTQLLPARGIQASEDQILVMPGIDAARGLITRLLARPGDLVVVEEPGSRHWRRLLQEQGVQLNGRPLDDEGISVKGLHSDAELIVLTPSHQLPTGITMSTERRRAILKWAGQRATLIVEDDHAAEANYLGQPHPALFGMDPDARVIYLSSLSKSLSANLQIAFIVAPAPVVQAARELRRRLFGSPPRNNQRAMAYFLTLGHYDAFHRRLDSIFRSRWLALRDALNHYLPNLVVTAPSQGGTTHWVEGPDWLDARVLAREAALRGVLIEPVDHYYPEGNSPITSFRLGVTSLDESRIRAGVSALANVIRDLSAGRVETLDSCRGEHLRGALLRSRLSGATLRFNTVYGDPASICLYTDGRMQGWAGYANEDVDQGQWWVDGDLWFRRWDSWSYGKTLGLAVVIDGSEIKWFNPEGQLIDAAHISDAFS